MEKPLTPEERIKAFANGTLWNGDSGFLNQQESIHERAIRIRDAEIASLKAKVKELEDSSLTLYSGGKMAKRKARAKGSLATIVVYEEMVKAAMEAEAQFDYVPMVNATDEYHSGYLEGMAHLINKLGERLNIRTGG